MPALIVIIYDKKMHRQLFADATSYLIDGFYFDLCASISISINWPSTASPFTSSQVPVEN